MVARETQRTKILLLQGGGALGAFECGAYRALAEEGIRFDIVAGVSIGAVNGALIAGNADADRVAALDRFWEEVAISLPLGPNEALRRAASAAYVMTFGNPRMFTPRWFAPWQSMVYPGVWNSLYDTGPLKRLLEQLVNFDRLARKETRLLLEAVDVERGTVRMFDSHEERLTVDHVLASGGLPPGLPWAMVGGRAYWDGGLISNAPLAEVLARALSEGSLLRLTEAPKREVYLVDLFRRRGRLPANLGEVTERYKDIVYSAKIAGAVRQFELMDRTLALMNETLGRLPEQEAQQVRQDRRYMDLLSHAWAVDLVRISRGDDDAEEHLFFKDFDFSRETIEASKKAGYSQALAAIRRHRDSVGKRQTPKGTNPAGNPRSRMSKRQTRSTI